jgi:hypothetical protein
MLLRLLRLIRRDEFLSAHPGGHVPHLAVDFLHLGLLVLKDGQVCWVVGGAEDGRECRGTLGVEKLDVRSYPKFDILGRAQNGLKVAIDLAHRLIK